MTKSKSNGSAARQERKKAKFEAKKREREQQQQQDVVVPPVVRLDGVFSSPGPSARRLLPVVRPQRPLPGPFSPAGPVAVPSSPVFGPPASPPPGLDGYSAALAEEQSPPSSPGFVLGPVSPSAPPGLAAYFERVAEEQSALEEHRGPQFDPRTKPVVTPVGIPTTAAGADLGVMTHAPSGQAGMSGLVTPRASRHAGSNGTSPFGDMTIGEVNGILSLHGFDTFDRMSNESFLRKEGCSSAGHQLRHFLENYRSLKDRYEYKLAHGTNRTSRHDECRLVSESSKVSLSGSECKHCGKETSHHMPLHRLSAGLQEPKENAWMLFVNERDSANARVFHASHVCKHPTRYRCVTAGHVFLETMNQNSLRKSHHNGNSSCTHDIIPCVGPDVYGRNAGRGFGEHLAALDSHS